MEWGAVGILLLSGFCSMSSSLNQKAFHFISQNMTWSDAQTYCRKNFVDLSTIRDTSDLVTLRGLVTTSDEHVFIGLRRLWFWTILDTEDIREADITFRHFENGQPGTEDDCGLIKPSGEWATGNCTTELPFFCFDASAPNISQRFVMVNESRYWGPGRYYCRKYYTDLARVRTLEENQRLLELYSDGPAWIGLTQQEWAWSDGSFNAFAPWVPGEPVGGVCSALHISGNPLGIVSRKCNETNPFFCYSVQQKKHVVKIVLSSDSAVNLADSATSDSLKDWVRTKLNDRGFSKDVRLTWSKRPEKVLSAPPPEEPLCPLDIINP